LGEITTKKDEANGTSDPFNTVGSGLQTDVVSPDSVK
jgi:hypothetical protein